MDIYNLLRDLEQVDPEVYDRLDSRRSVFRHLVGAGQKLTAALPVFVGAVLNKAYGQTPAGLRLTDVLNYALRLEYLEMYFYQQRTTLSGLSGANSTALSQIATDEANHVTFLRGVIVSLGGTPVADPSAATFDFSGARLSSTNTTGPFGNWRTNADTYLALAQSFEDLGVRAYKGAAPLTPVMLNKTVLTAALSIHGVEARHAARIRAMRRAGPGAANASQGVAVAPYNAAPKSWIAGVDNGGPAAAYTAPVYGAGNDSGAAVYGSAGQGGSAAGISFPAESNTTQGGVNLQNATSITLPTNSTAFSEAFDEGLDVGTVSAIARGFTIGSSTFFNF